MILSMTGQAWLFLFTVALGFAAGFLFDFFRIFRKTFKHPDFLTQLEDLVYWLSITVLIFYFMLNENNGEIRVFSIVGMFLGMILYFCTLSFVVFNVSVAVINFFKKVFALALKIILFPIRLIIKIVMFPVGAIARILSPVVNRAKNRTKRGLKKTKRYAKMKSLKLVKDFKIIFKKV